MKLNQYEKSAHSRKSAVTFEPNTFSYVKTCKKKAEVLKCISCEFESTDKNSYLNHIVDNHSTVHICQSCNNRFPSKNKLVEHIIIDHRSIYTNSGEKSQDINKIRCFDCGTMLETKDELMKHNREEHWKQKHCPYFHGEGRQCRFPDRICLNIHWPEEPGDSGPDTGGQGD